MPSFAQRKSSLTKETSNGHSSPSKSPEHYHRTAESVNRQPLSDHHSDQAVETPSLCSYEQPVVHERPKRHRGPTVWGDKDKVVLLVDGKRFSICPLLLTRQPNTMLGRSCDVYVENE